MAANPATIMMRAFERETEQRTTRTRRRKPAGLRTRTRRRPDDAV